jgi:hypothetical protein
MSLDERLLPRPAEEVAIGARNALDSDCDSLYDQSSIANNSLLTDYRARALIRTGVT